MGMAPRRIAIGCAFGASLLIGLSPPALATFGTSTMVCTGEVDETFSPILTAIPSATAVSLSTPALNCTAALGSPTVSITAQAVQPAGAACVGPIAVIPNSGGSIVLNGNSASVTWTATGTTASQLWTFTQISANPTVEAVGVGVWLNAASEIPTCITAGQTMIKFLAVLVIVA
jgi:hypothetical protein